jgi:thiamine phosphate synthase YjbQ (UPF0047 family)
MLLGTSESVPVSAGKLKTGAYQNIIVVSVT